MTVAALDGTVIGPASATPGPMESARARVRFARRGHGVVLDATPKDSGPAACPRSPWPIPPTPDRWE